MAVPCPPGDAHRLGCRAPIHERPGIARMAQPRMATVRAGQAPQDVLAHGPRAHRWQRQRCRTIPEHRVTGTAQGPPLLQDASDGVLDVALGDLCDPLIPGADEPDGDFPHAMAALTFRFKGLASPLPHAAQLICGHGALHPEDEPVMALARIIDAVISDAQRLRQRTQIKPMMPGPMVAGSPAGCQGEDGADTPGTHGGQQLATARALVASRPTPAPILINHDDVGKPSPASLIGEGIVPPRALGVRPDLMARGLADRDGGVTLEMERVHLGAQGDTPHSGPWG